MFYVKYVGLCNKRNKSPSAVAEEIGFKRSVVTAWKNGRAPRQATLQKIADFFGVDYTYFNDQIDGKEPAEAGELESYLEDLRERPETRALLEASRGMTKEQVDKVADFVRFLRGDGH